MNEDKEVQVTAAELRKAMESEMAALLRDVSDAMNRARDGAIIADSEIPVRDAVARFRQKLYERAMQLKADKAAKAAFSPSAQRRRDVAAGQGHSGGQPSDGQRDDSH
jgi:hypothetical protein